MIRKMILAAAAMAAMVLTVAQTPAMAGGGNNEVRVEARLTGDTLASGKARYREKSRNNAIQQRFKVEVEDFAPDTELQVHVNGTLVGTIITNDLGMGELQFRTAAFIDDPGDGTPIDPEFPTLQPGDQITVGPLSGTFEID